MLVTADDRYLCEALWPTFGCRPCQKANRGAKSDTVSNSMNKMRIYLQGSEAAPRAATAPASEDYKETVPANAVPIQSVIAKIKYLASLEPTELAAKMNTEEGACLAQVEIEPAELQSLLRPWNAIRRASSDPLTDGQYDAFLRGEHAVADAVEFYGSHLQSES